MKFKYLLLCFLIAGLYSCNMDFEPTDAYSEETFWYSAKNAESGLTGCYLPLFNEAVYGGRSIAWEECATPNAYNYINDSGWNDIATGSATADESIFANRWRQCYVGIGRCNLLLENIDVNEEMTAEQILQMKAQARFLRALYYSILTTYYYKVPFITTSPDISQYEQGREERSVLINFIISELDAVADILPASYSSSDDQGQPTSGAAMALKARVLLFEASPLCNSDNNTDAWRAAANAAEAVINTNRYSLYQDSYAGLFTEAAEHSSESIFDVEFIDEPLGNGHSIDIVMRQYNSSAPVKGFVDSYRMLDGKPRAESSYSGSGEYEDRDPRFAQTIVYPGSTWMGLTVVAGDNGGRFTNAQTGYIFKKYTVYTEAVPSNEELNIREYGSPINIMVLRYADILLMYAEAKNELGELTEDVWNRTIRLIRRRAGFTLASALDYPGSDQSELRDIIKYERRVELALEGTYYNDLRRWKDAETVMNGISIAKSDGTVIMNRNFNADRDYWWPVPASQLEIAPTLGPNNPGW